LREQRRAVISASARWSRTDRAPETGRHAIRRHRPRGPTSARDLEAGAVV